MATWGLVNSYGVFQTYYETDLLSENSSSAISWIGSVQACLLMVIGVVAGPLYDAGYFRHLLVTGQLLLVFGMFMTSLWTAYWHILLAQGVCVGLGMGLIFLPSTAILAQYFTTRRALAIGISSSGSPLAGIIFPIIFSKFVPRLGFAVCTLLLAGISNDFSGSAARRLPSQATICSQDISQNTSVGGKQGSKLMKII